MTLPGEWKQAFGTSRYITTHTLTGVKWSAFVEHFNGGLRYTVYRGRRLRAGDRVLRSAEPYSEADRELAKHDAFVHMKQLADRETPDPGTDAGFRRRLDAARAEIQA